jgi:hypothetical protein
MHHARYVDERPNEATGAQVRRDFLAAVVLVTALAFLGVALEHSSFSSAVAPHSPVGHLNQVTVRVVRPDGQRGTEKVRLPPGFRQRPRGVVKLGGGSPFDGADWTLVAQNLGLVAAIALPIVGLDQLRRVARRRRRVRRPSVAEPSPW